jgi:phage tail sheath protein FI
VSARTITGVRTSIAAFVGFATTGPLDEPRRVRSFTEFERMFGGLSQGSTMSFAVQQFFLNGGGDALIVRAHRAAGDETDLVPVSPNGKGLYALEAADIFNLLVVPPVIRDGVLGAHSRAAASRYCSSRRALYIVDPDPSWSNASDIAEGSTLETFSSGIERTNAAVYFPRVRMVDAEAGTADVFPPSGAVAGVIARTDVTRGVWKAPAGLDAALVGVQELDAELDDSQTGRLSRLGVNCLRTFPAVGPVVWGARTLAGADGLASEWKYVPVRRLAHFVEESLYRGTRWADPEPNEESTWSQIRLHAGAFMQTLFREGAFQGGSPSQAYFVKCDAETTSQTDRELGVVNIEVGFAPLRPAEFVIIRIQQLAGRGPT